MESYANDQYFIAGVLCDRAMKIVLEQDTLGKEDIKAHIIKAKQILTSWKIKEVFPIGVPAELLDYYLKAIKYHPGILGCH